MKAHYSTKARRWRALARLCLCLGDLFLFGPWACGNLQSPLERGDPLVTLRGTLEGEVSAGDPTDAPSVALVWRVLPAEVQACVRSAATDEDALWRCYGEVARGQTVAQSVAVRVQFPDGFELPIYSLPSVEALNGQAGSWLGSGTIVAFNDANGNGRFDLLSHEATDPIDTVLSRVGDTPEIIYRDGELDASWRRYRLDGCPEPPQGYSVLRYDRDAPLTCTAGHCAHPCYVDPVSEPIPLRLGASTRDDRETVCGPPPEDSYARSYPATEPPATAETRCTSFGRTLLVNEHRERYCTQANTYRVTLEGLRGAWNLVESPPAWWPCDVQTFDESGTPPPLEGAYAVTEHRQTEGDCDPTHARPVKGSTSIVIAPEGYFSSVFQQAVIGVFDCDDSDACAETFDQTWGLFGWMEGAWRGEWTLVESVGAQDCQITKSVSVIRSVDARGELRLEREQSALRFSLTQDESCIPEEVEPRERDLVCRMFEEMTLTRRP